MLIEDYDFDYDFAKPYNTVKSEQQDKLTASEALYGFCGWLTSREEKTIMSATDECGIIARLVETFCKENKLKPPRSGWETNLIHPSGECSFCTEHTTHPEHGWFDGAIDNMWKRKGITDMEANILNDLTEAHSRDMDVAQKKIDNVQRSLSWHCDYKTKTGKQIAAIEAKNTRLQEQVEILNRIIDEIHDTFYGRNMSVTGWHLNGELEPIDNFFDSNYWSKEDI